MMSFSGSGAAVLNAMCSDDVGEAALIVVLEHGAGADDDRSSAYPAGLVLRRMW